MTKVIDLFAGCGGFSTGFSKAGYEIVSAVEFDEQIAKSYEKNHPGTRMIADDIKNVDNAGIFQRGEAEVIIGGPPCQGFSMAGARIRNGFIDDPRNYLFKHYFNVVKLVRPKIFILENVKGIFSMKGGEIFREIRATFENPENFDPDDGFDGKPYKIQYMVARAKEFGIPQKRERAIIVGSLVDFDLQKEVEKTRAEILENNPRFFDNVTVWEAISNLPEPTDDGKVEVTEFKSNYQKYLRAQNKFVENHVKTKHSKKATERMQKIKPDENFTVLDEKINSVHSGAYGRLNPEGLAPTITTRFDTPSGGKFIHPYENRTLTPREAARLQSFPDDFEFVGSKTSVCKQIGNAVPPKLAYFFGIMIERILNGK